jgi:DNA-binding XRE family transcriptional regulator
VGSCLNVHLQSHVNTTPQLDKGPPPHFGTPLAHPKTMKNEKYKKPIHYTSATIIRKTGIRITVEISSRHNKAYRRNFQLGFLIREKRTSLGLNQETFAKLLQIERTYVSKLEHGIANPSLALMKKIHELQALQPKPISALNDALNYH